jgi:hypothetical protein
MSSVFFQYKSMFCQYFTYILFQCEALHSDRKDKGERFYRKRRIYHIKINKSCKVILKMLADVVLLVYAKY